MNNLIDIKNARILWNHEFCDIKKTYVISDLIVAEFNLDTYEEAKKMGKTGASVWPMYLYEYISRNGKGYHLDIGNCNKGWEDTRPIDIILEFFVFEEYKDKKIKEKTIKELCKIKEIREEFILSKNIADVWRGLDII